MDMTGALSFLIDVCTMHIATSAHHTCMYSAEQLMLSDQIILSNFGTKNARSKWFTVLQIAHQDDLKGIICIFVNLKYLFLTVNY